MIKFLEWKQIQLCVDYTETQKRYTNTIKKYVCIDLSYNLLKCIKNNKPKSVTTRNQILLYC